MFIEYLDNIRSLGRQSFTFVELINELKISINSAKSALYRMKKEHRLISPSKGFYVIVPPEHRIQGSIPAEELTPILMKQLKLDYYVSLLSGAVFYGVAHQKSLNFQIVTNKRINNKLEFGKIKLELVYKKKLESLPIQNFIVNTGYLKVASPELLIFDLLKYQNRAGGLNNIATVLFELIDLVKLKNLLKLAEHVKEKAWLQRLGYILEQIKPKNEKKVFKFTEKLSQYINKKEAVFISLAPELSKKGYPRIKKWKIIANTNIESDFDL